MNFIKRVWNGIKSFVSPKATAVTATVGTGIAAFAQTAPADPGAAITSASTTILSYIAIFGAALIGIKLAAVGWRVGAKLISRLGGGS